MRTLLFPICLCLMLALTAASCRSSDRKPDSPPNVLFILADDLGYHDLSCTGSTFYETPNIDRIAREGTAFTQGYAACQVCSPSRASILSGKFPARHGITDWIGAATGTDWSRLGRQTRLLPPAYGDHLPLEYTILPEALKSAGYTTFMAGKWHLGDTGSYPEDHGFDINKGGWKAGSPNGGYFSPYENPKLADGPNGENLSMRLARETAQFIQDHQGQPFFAYLSFYAVHGPIQTTREKWKKYRDKAESRGVADHGYVMERRLPIRQVQDNPVYAGLVEAMDDAVGVVLRKLDELGLAENTLVIFTSDNGGVASGDAYSTSNLPLRGGKGYQWEGGIREPFFIKAPWLKDQVKQCATPAVNTDFYPTILDLLGLPLRPEEHQDGISLVSLLTGGTIPDRPLYWHYPHYGNQGGDPSSIIREGKWKLIHYWETDTNELYDLEADPAEEVDLSARYIETADQLWHKLDSWLNGVGARRPTPDPDYSEDRERARMEQIRTELWPQKEAERLRYLAPDYAPDPHWWGSEE